MILLGAVGETSHTFDSARKLVYICANRKRAKNRKMRTWREPRYRRKTPDESAEKRSFDFENIVVFDTFP